MPTFATGADFNVPTPQGSGGIPRGGGGRASVPAARIPGDPSRIATSGAIPGAASPSGIPAQVMLDESRQTADLGTALDRFGATVDKFAETLDQTAAQEALNTLRAKRQEMTYDPEKGYQKYRGGAATKNGPGGMPLLDELPAGLQSAADEIGGGLSSRSRKLFSEAASREVLGYKKDLSVHVANESEKYEAAVYKDTQLGALSEAVTVADDPLKLKEVADRAARAADIRASQTGLPSQAKEARSNVLRSAIEGQIASGNGSRALSMYQALLPDLDGRDRVALGPTMRTVGIGETAKYQAGALTATMPAPGQAEEGTKTSMAFWTADGYSSKAAAGLTAGFLGESQFFPGARNKGDGRDGSDSINIGQWNSGRAKALLEFAQKKGLDPNKVETGLLYAKAEIDGEIPRAISGVSPDLKAKLQNAKTEQEAADIMVRGYFKPLDQDGQSHVRGKTASGVLAKYGTQTPDDPLKKSVDTATGATPDGGKPKDGPKYLDTRQMLLDAEKTYDVATRRNAEINGGNDDQRRATQSQLDLNLAATKRSIDIAKLQLEVSVDKWMTTGGPPDAQGNPTSALQRPPPEIWNQLPYQKQQSIDATIAHNAKGTVAVTNDRVWGEIHRGITNEDPAVRAEWAQKSLWEYKKDLSSSDYQELSKLQAAGRTGDPNKDLTHVRSISTMVTDALQKLKADKDPEKVDKFNRIVQGQVNELERQQKRKATPEEQQKIIDRTAMDVFVGKGTLWGEKTKPRYEMTIADVPAAEKTEITASLNRRKIPVTDENIIELYARGNARPKK